MYKKGYRLRTTVDKYIIQLKNNTFPETCPETVIKHLISLGFLIRIDDYRFIKNIPKLNKITIRTNEMGLPELWYDEHYIESEFRSRCRECGECLNIDKKLKFCNTKQIFIADLKYPACENFVEKSIRKFKKRRIVPKD